MRLLIPSAAATLLALLVGGLLLMNGTASLAFADVVENVKNAKSVTYVLKSKFESQAALEHEQTEQERRFYIHGNAHRVEFFAAQAGGQVPQGAPLILLALIVDAKEKKALGLSEKRLAFRQDKPLPADLKAIGLREDDVIVGVDGLEAAMTMREFLAFLRRNYLVGERVTLNVLRGGKRAGLPLTLK